MIILYSGTAGSGKSLHLARRVSDELCVRKKAVIANFPINLDVVSHNGKRKIGDFLYKPNNEITVDFLMEYAKQHHKIGIEGQTLLVIDEAGIMFNARDPSSFDRKAWVDFFMIHRHFGFNVLLISPHNRIIDRQVRYLIEYDVKHRKANNFRTFGFILTLLHIPVFVAITYWFGINERCSSEFFFYRKRDRKLYDTMMIFGGDQHGSLIGTSSEAAPSPDGDAGACGGGAPAGMEPPQDACSVEVPV